MRFARTSSPGRLRHLLLLAAVATLAAIPAVSWIPPSSVASASVLQLPSENGGVVVAPAYVPGPTVADLGPLRSSQPVDVAVGLAGADPSGAVAALNLIATPGTPEYRHYLAPAEVAKRLGATPAQYDAAAREFTNAGLSVRTSPDRSLLLVSGPSSAVATAFGTTFEAYRDAGRTFFSHPTAAFLPAGLPWSGALGLGNVTPIRPAAVGARPSAGPAAGCTGSGGSGFTPCQIEKGYNVTGLIAAGSNGTGHVLAVVDAYDGTEPQGQLQSDLALFDSSTGTAAGTVDYLYPVPTNTDLNSTSTGWGFEEALDLEWARAMSPAATIKMTFAPDPTAGLYGSVDWLVAHRAADVISLSWGENDVGVYNAYVAGCATGCNATADGSYALLHPVFQAAALEGITVLSATGDCGAAAGTSGVSTDYPASDPYVVAVGGTDLTLGAGNAYSSETGWSGNASGGSSPGCYNQGGSGGGYSPFPRPYWQAGSGIPANRTVRGIPDVSAIGGGAGVEVYYQSFALAARGTSVSCPVWAGVISDFDTYAGANLGFVTPSLYVVAAGPSGPKALHDVTTGSNGYRASVGWDAVTGLGSPNGGNLAPLLARTLVAQPPIQLSLSASPRFGAAPLTVSFNASATGGATPYSFYEVDFGGTNASLAPRGVVNHTYAQNGAYSAWAVVFDAAANSSVSEPVEIVVGGQALLVALNTSLPSPAVGQPVTLQANVSGGTAPYTYNWSFGDGTYLHNGTSASELHSYGYAGGFCTTVAVHDSQTPQDGGGSNRILELVGGALSGYCPNATAIVATLNATPLARDLPGDFALAPNITGGTPPYTLQYASDDPYVALCNCPIFRTPGVHPLRVFINDSVNQEASASTNVTLYPTLVGTFTPSATSGPAPLFVRFNSTVHGGHGANATTWQFGDGQSANGSQANHTYSTPGFYVAVADASDGFGGNASEAFLIDVTATGATGPVVTATISPAVRVPTGTLATFSSSVVGTGGPYTVNWSFAPSSFSGFGTSLQETFPYRACLAEGTCLFWANLTVHAPNGTVLDEIPMALSPAEAGNVSGLTFLSSVGPRAGDAPFVVFGSASATGVAGSTLNWSFNDGGTAVGGSVSHVYQKNGNYTASVWAGDRAGEFLVHTVAITGTGPGPGVVVVTGGPNVSAGVAPLRLDFNASALGGAGAPYNYTWTFGDGAFGYGPAPNHTYTRAANYQGFVSARDGRGTNGTSAFTLQVYNATAVGLVATVAPNATRAGQPVQLSVAASPLCTAMSVPGCAPRNVTLEAEVKLAGALGIPVPTTNVTSFAVPLDGNGRGVVGLDAPGQLGTYAVSVQTVGRNYTGLVIAYLVVNATVPAPPPDRSLELLGIGAGAGLLAAAAAFVLLGRRRLSKAAAERPSPTAPNT